MKGVKTLIASIFLCFIAAPSSTARPSNLQEQDNARWKSLSQGVYVGFETLLALMGYYEEEEVKESMKSGDLNIDAEDEENQTTIQIVGLGLGRTGTTSVAMAMEFLQYTVVHDDEQTEITDLYDAEEEEDIDADEMHEILGLRGFNATFKTASYRWVADHPEVKAIVTVRDTPDKYVDSWLLAAPFMKTLEKMPYRWMPTVKTLMPSFEAEYKHETTNGKPDDFLDRDTLRVNYVNYLQKVKEAIPAERLLVFNVKQGWGPLCEFLGKPIPEGVPFPHVHTRAKLQGEMWFLELITWIWPLGVILPVVCVNIIVKLILRMMKL